MTHLCRLDESPNTGRILNQVADQLADAGREGDDRTLTQRAYHMVKPDGQDRTTEVSGGSY